LTGDEAGPVRRAWRDGGAVAAGAALDKLRAVLPRDRQEHVERLARQTVVLGRSGHVATDPAAQPWLLAVQRAVAQRRVLRLDYRAAGRLDDTRREVAA
jgi:predicted DNA-binding transcriptional regulator YafY